MAKIRTARQRAASRKNLIAARKKRRRRAAAIGATGVALGTGALVARHKISGSSFSASKGPNVSMMTGGRLSNGVVRTGTSVTIKTGKTKRTLSYHHKKATRDVVGRKFDNSPLAVVGRAPRNAVERRRMAQFNYAHTEDQKAASAIKYAHSNPNLRYKAISEDEAGRRTQSYMNSMGGRGSARAQNRRRERALKYYRGQPRYDGSGQSGRRGRQRSRDLKAQKK